MSTHSHHEEIPKRLDKEFINELPLIRFRGAIKVAEDSKSFNRYALQLKKQRVLGFDVECKPNFKRGPNNPPALIQLATADQAFCFAYTRSTNLVHWLIYWKIQTSSKLELQLKTIS